MATYTSNYGWTKPSGSDNVDISVLNDNLDDQDSTIHDAFLNMAPPFSESSTYAVDDIVLYDTGLYKCHTAVVTPGSWTGSTNWQVYKLSEGGGGGLTLGETSSTAYRGDRGKTAYDHSQIVSGNPHGTTAADVGLGNVPNVSTNDQEPTFTEASTRNNIASGDKLSVILGKIQKFFNDLKTVAFSGSYNDLTDKPSISTSAGDISYDNTDSGLTATDVQDAIDEVVSKAMRKTSPTFTPSSEVTVNDARLVEQNGMLFYWMRLTISSTNTSPTVGTISNVSFPGSTTSLYANNVGIYGTTPHSVAGRLLYDGQLQVFVDMAAPVSTDLWVSGMAQVTN